MRGFRGFTLIELMVVIAIIAIIVVVAVPSYNDYNNNQKLTENANKLQTVLRQAQNNAQTGKVCNDGSKAIYWYIPLSNNVTSYSLNPSCAGIQQSEVVTSLSPGVVISNVSVVTAVVVNGLPQRTLCSPSATQSLDLRFNNISSAVSFVASECPEKANDSLEITLSLTGTTNTRTVVVEKGGGIYVSRNQ